MACVVIVLRHVLEVVACTAPRFWRRKCRYPRIRGFMLIPQAPQFPMYGFICIFIGPKYIPTYHPHTSNPQGPSQPRMYTPNPQCPLSAKCDRGSQPGPPSPPILRYLYLYRRMGQAARQLARVTSSGVLQIEKI